MWAGMEFSYFLFLMYSILIAFAREWCDVTNDAVDEGN